MAYSADLTLATTVSFQNQVQMSMVKAAVSIAAEARTVHNAADLKRQFLANKVLNNPTTLLTQFCFAAVEAGTLSGSPTDAQIDTAIASCWNGIAGVTPADLA